MYIHICIYIYIYIEREREIDIHKYINAGQRKRGDGFQEPLPAYSLEPLLLSTRRGSKSPGFVPRSLSPYAITSLGVMCVYIYIYMYIHIHIYVFVKLLYMHIRIHYNVL